MKKYLLIVISLFIQIVSVVAQQTYSDIARQADDFLKKGKNQEANEAYTKAIGMKADEFGLWMNRGITRMNLKRYADAVNDFNQALKLKANDASALQGRASSKAMLKDYKGAIADFTSLITLRPTDYSFILERGKVKVQAEDFFGALLDLKECLNHSFKLAEANYWIGVVYFTQKDFTRAAEAFEKAGTMEDANFRGALAYGELGRFKKAVEILNPMFQKDPSNVTIYILRATLCINSKNHTQAKADIAKIKELKPGSTDFVMLRIMLNNSLSDYDGALHEIDSLLQSFPSGNELLFLERAKALYHLAKYDEAESMFEQAMAMNLENKQAYYERCLMHIELEEYRQAMFYANKAVELSDQQPESWYLKGRSLIGLGQGEAAFVAINQGLEIDREQPEVGHHYLGMAYYTMRNTTEAMKAFEKALSVNASYTPVRIDRADILLKLGKDQDALSDYQRVLKIDPDNAPAYCGQGKVFVQQKKYEQALQAFKSH